MNKKQLEYRLDQNLIEDIQEWRQSPESHFQGQFNKPLKWSHQILGLAGITGDIDTHGTLLMPNISANYHSNEGFDLTFGWIEGIHMVGGGLAIVGHFALQKQISNLGLGVALFGAVARFLKQNNATEIEFRESHPSRIHHYRVFFEKLGIKEIRHGVWYLPLYPYLPPPTSVLEFHEQLFT
ncbi:hypothetical protein A1QO_03870 [Vibrio genomosp. F10 str. ZF-129]|uniref:N-acetyltransferase domain-containing protein n=1 Tax=Vibrio genomosp. F10 str. ZF-129 TaxID=1187848 RepID=A0A1E5BIM5_9VIBR|nr:hypothetical protein [Vibrio genomosp. F10]OEE37250.1 hypothetical protein A1QO_03870 [Vibrio genomosp. F10 str. ZF-129]